MAEVQTINITYDVESKVETFHWWFVVRRKLLKSLLSSLNLKKNCTVLDIGCGTGSNLRMVGASGFNVIGLDRSTYALSLTKKKLNFPLISGDLNRLPIRPKSVGIIVAMDIFEHLENDLNGIHEIYQALKKEGILILTVPAFSFLWGVQDIITDHKRRYSKREILNKLRREGFEVKRASYFNFFLFFPVLLARWLIRFLKLRVKSENEINSPLINSILKVIFSMEPYILRYFSFPFGVSIFCIAEKR